MTRLLLTILTGLLGCITLHAQSINFNGISLFEITSSDFVCVPGAYNTIGNATTAGNCINMTSGGFEAGAVWICDGIDLNQNFKVSFNANFGTNISTGDGIAFLLQQEALPNIIGGRGGGLGYAVGDGVGCQSGACPIDPSVAVEFDTYDGSAWFDNDLPCNHMSIQIDGSTGAAATVEGPSCLLPSGASVLDGLNHEICITWEPSVLEYKIYFDGVQIGEFNGDIRPYFPNPSDVWWGFTAASGGAPQNQSVCNIVMETNISNPTCICSSSMTVTSNSNPSTCNGTNGSLIIGGLDPNATYSLTYDLDGINNGPLSITTNSSGEYLLFGLGDGSYTNFDAELLGCVSSVTGPIILTQPSPPVLVINDPAARCAPGSVDLTDPSVTAGSTGSGTLTYWQNSGASTPLSNPNSVNTTGTYYIQSDNGCEDIEAVNVTINPSPVLDVPIPFSTTICSGESPDVSPTANIPGSTFSWSTSSSSVNLSGFSNFGSGNINENISNSGNTTESVTYTILPTSPSPASCDGSSANYVVYVLPSEASVDVQVSCTSYTWIDGNTYTSSNNSATVVLSNTAGCDSTVTLDLTITNSNTGTDVITSCDSYTWIDGNTYTSSNNSATVVLSNTAGCDSTVTLDLTITNSNTGTDVITSCDSYTWIDGTTYTSSNNSATVVLSNTAGCDSTVTLDLTITNSNTGTDVITSCDSYTWIDGNTYTSSNNSATVVLSNTAGCDSTVTLDLTITNSNTGTDVITSCDSYTWIDGTTYTSSNNSATVVLSNTAGCDSTVTLDLTITNSNTGTDVITSCDSYTWIDGNTYTSSNNSATLMLSNTNGCDSLVTLDLTINNSYSTTDNHGACDSYTWIDGNTYTTSNNTATVMLTSISGCDSLVTLDLIIDNSLTGTDVITACDSYTWIDGTTYTSSNNSATILLTASGGCDSLVTLNLTLGNSNTGTDVITSCDSYTWIDGTTYTSSNNSATVVLSNASGCDSTVTLDLTITNSNTGTDVITSCDSYTWIDGVTYTSSNNSATVVLSNTAGCDSTVTLDLTITNSNTGTDVITSCDSYTWINGTTYTSSNNSATVVLSNTAGCDSTVTLDLTITNSNTGTDVITSCDSYTWINGTTYTSSNNSATVVLSNTAGCDSTVTLDLTITNSNAGSETYAGCSGDGYAVLVNGTTYDEANPVGSETLSNAFGCDSTVTIDLTFNTVNNGVETYTGCSGDGYAIVVNGVTYDESNPSGTETMSNIFGCDSTISIDLTFNSPSTGSEVHIGCNGDGYAVTVNGIIYNEANPTGIETLSNINGCDSVVTINLTFNSSITGNESYTGCTGDGYSVVVNGTTYDEANPSGTETLTAVAGCDSIVTVDLVFNTVFPGTDVQAACDSYTWIDGNTYTASNNSATWVLPSVSGCDSTVTLDLTITNSNTGTDTQSECDSFIWIDGNTYTSSNNSATWVLTNIDGCDSLVTLDLTINASPTLIDFTNGGIYCQGEVVNGLVAEVSGVPDFTLDYTLNGNPLSISSSSSSIDVGSSAGEYTLNALTDNYCTTTLNQSQTIVINPIPDIPSLGEDAIYCSNAVPEAIQATGSTGSYNWYVDAALTELLVTADEYTPDMILGSYTYYVTASENGCEGFPAEVSITFEDCQIIIPTAFTPDNDQVNDFWELGNIDDIYPKNVVSVYNRWGNKVYESDQGAYDQRPWKGDYNGNFLPVGSYYYTIDYNDQVNKSKTGVVSIIK